MEARQRWEKWIPGSRLRAPRNDEDWDLGKGNSARPKPRALVPAVGRKALELPLHRIDVSDIGRDQVIATALAGHHLKMTARESGRRTRAAEMDEGREILLLAGG